MTMSDPRICRFCIFWGGKAESKMGFCTHDSTLDAKQRPRVVVEAEHSCRLYAASIDDTLYVPKPETAVDEALGKKKAKSKPPTPRLEETAPLRWSTLTQFLEDRPDRRIPHTYAGVNSLQYRSVRVRDAEFFGYPVFTTEIDAEEVAGFVSIRDRTPVALVLRDIHFAENASRAVTEDLQPDHPFVSEVLGHHGRPVIYRYDASLQRHRLICHILVASVDGFSRFVHEPIGPFMFDETRRYMTPRTETVYRISLEIRNVHIQMSVS